MNLPLASNEVHGFTLGDYLDFRNGKTSPTRDVHGIYSVYGSNGQIGHSNDANTTNPSIAIGRVGSYCGSLYFVDGPAWITDNAIICTPKDSADSRYWYYALQTLGLNARSSGSGQPLLNQSILSSIKYSAPARSMRNAIAEVLGALDDKIAANTKLATTSAQLARAIFTKASTNAQRTEMVLIDSCLLLSRGITPKYSDEDESMVVLNQKCVRGHRVNLEPSRRTLLAKVRPDKVLLQNDVLVNSTGQGTLGRVARWTHNNEATVDSHITIVRFNPELVDPACGGFAVLQNEENITAMAEGSTGQTELSRVELGKLRITLPAKEQQPSLGHQLARMTAMENAYLQENNSLAATRDALLPQLMSGKLRVKDAENIVSAAV